MSLEALLRPKKICIVGASEKAGFGGDTSRNVIDLSRADSYYFVNPKRDQIFGHPCYSSIDALPESIDLVVLCTPQSTVNNLLEQAHNKGAQAAVVFASGYKEAGTPEGLQNQEALQKKAEKLQMSIMGPNCAGFINYIDGISPFAFLSEERDRKGKVGLVSQSGQLCLSMMDSSFGKFSYVISAGNCDVISMEEYISFLVDDPDTKVVAVYLEGVVHPEKLVTAFRNAALKRKPIVVLKAGRSSKGEKLAASHTGSLAGSNRMFDALFKKFGVIRVNDLEELLYTSHVLATLPSLPKVPTLASMSLSGGETGISADVGDAEGLEFPDFTEETQSRLQKLLPAYATPANPLDMTATLSYDTQLFAEALRVVMADDNVGMLVVGYTLLQEINDPAIEYMAPAMIQVMQEKEAKPILMLPYMGNTRNQKYSELLEEAGIPILPPPVYAMKILRYLTEFIQYNPDDHQLEISIADHTVDHNKRMSMSEYESKVFLSENGVPCEVGAIAKTEEQALEFGRKFGFPLVMKIESSDILHKSDIGGVKLNIRTEEAIRENYNLILANAKASKPNARINGVLMQKMREAGTEIILGINSDNLLGTSVLVGLGGVFVEVFKDTAIGLAPISETEARQMVDSLKGKILLEGYRGHSPRDMESLVDLILKMSDLAVKYKNDGIEVDLNPVFIYEKGICAVDAVVIKG